MKKITGIGLLLGLTASGWGAQAQGIGDQEIIIEKDRQVTIPPANRVLEKISLLPAGSNPVKTNYTFFDRKPTGLETVEFKPTIISPFFGDKKKEVASYYKNQVKLGAGNFGRTYGELFINSPQNQKLTFGLSALHNAARRGPIQNENSGASTNRISLDGKYVAKQFKLTGETGYERQVAHFYGYDTTFVDLSQEEIRQRFQTFHVGVGFENIKASAPVDYWVKTRLHTFSDFYDARELDLQSSGQFFFPLIPEKLLAKVQGEAYLTQRTDNYLDTPTRKRNLFRVYPSFSWNQAQWAISLGLKAVNEFDQINQISRTKGFPTVDITYKTPGLHYFSAGLDGDIVRNTLRGMIQENPFLMPQVDLLNTEKPLDVYVSAKGDLATGLTYFAKASYGAYRNLYFFQTSDLANGRGFLLRPFEITYEAEKIPFFRFETQWNYQPVELWRTNLKAMYQYFGVKSFSHAFHRPSVDITWGNTLLVSNKLIATLDLYHLGGLFAPDPFSFNEVKKLDPIYDLNAEVNYLLSKQFSVFVRLNNILGKNYQRFLYYPQQGLNFLVGVNISL
ncbi:MAG: hypothetical protein ACK4LB_07910 [Spirosomataceae bacterium]